MDAPFLTSGVPGLLGSCRQRPGDFRVEELGSYGPSGAGQHLWLWVEKAGLTTPAAVERLARALDLPPQRLGFAGLKDARAVTRQWVSVDRPPADAEQRLAGLGGSDEPTAGLRVLELDRHRNGLGRGHLLGNRFRLRLRLPGGSGGELLAGVRASLAELERRGVPAYFGPQRFGHRGDTARVGQALMGGEHREALELILGRPSERDTGAFRAARQHFEAGQLEAARQAWPRDERGPRHLLGLLLRGATPAEALAGLDKRERFFYGSAFQAELFNGLLARRLALASGGDEGAFDGVWAGDLALRLPLARRAFAVEDPAVEAERAARGEITASGPLFGHAMPRPEGRAAELEAEVLAAAGLTHEHFEGPEAAAWPGGRRGLRHPLVEPTACLGSDEHGPFLELGFDLPKGCYATGVLRELRAPD